MTGSSSSIVSTRDVSAALLLARSGRVAPDRLLARLPRAERAPVVPRFGLRTHRQLAGYSLLLTSMR